MNRRNRLMDRYDDKNETDKFESGNQCNFETFYFDDTKGADNGGTPPHQDDKMEK